MFLSYGNTYSPRLTKEKADIYAKFGFQILNPSRILSYANTKCEEASSRSYAPQDLEVQSSEQMPTADSPGPSPNVFPKTEQKEGRGLDYIWNAIFPSREVTVPLGRENEAVERSQETSGVACLTYYYLGQIVWLNAGETLKAWYRVSIWLMGAVLIRTLQAPSWFQLLCCDWSKRTHLSYSLLYLQTKIIYLQ